MPTLFQAKILLNGISQNTVSTFCLACNCTYMMSDIGLGKHQKKSKIKDELNETHILHQSIE